MKFKILFILAAITVLITFDVSAQTLQEQKAVIKAALNFVENHQGPIIYLKDISAAFDPSDSYCTKRIKKGKFYLYSRPNGSGIATDPLTGEETVIDSDVTITDSLILTKAEQKKILRLYGKACHWGNNLFPNSIGIDSIATGYKIIRQLQKTAYPDTSGKRYYIFAFAKPIFIRNGKVCLITIAAVCGGECGRTETAFYRKIKGQWKQWIVIGMGDF